MKNIIFFASSNKAELAVFTNNDPKLDRLFDSIAKYDCYGIGEKMIERLGQLPGFFEDAEDTGKPYSLLFSNNALMVMFNIASELLTQKTSELRTTHMRILHKRRTVKDDRTIGQNMRSGVIYGDVEYLNRLRSGVIYDNVEYLNRLLSIITPLIYAGDSLVVTESE